MLRTTNIIETRADNWARYLTAYLSDRLFVEQYILINDNGSLRSNNEDIEGIMHRNCAGIVN